MDILTHIVSGLAAGTVVANFGVTKHQPILKIISAGAIGGAFPDIDAVSLWSRFDATVGKWLGLSHTGSEIYFGKFWYSHHGFFHSVAASIIAGFLIGCVVYLYKWMRREQVTPLAFFKDHIYIYLAFIVGCIVHMLGDLITPSSVWGGIRMFWPAHTYVGGWGNIWWWNNYDIFLILCLCVVINMILLFTAHWVRVRADVVSLIFTLVAFGAICFQVNKRDTDYAYKGHTPRYQQLETKSKEDQKRMLNPKVYYYMEIFDQNMPFHF